MGKTRLLIGSAYRSPSLTEDGNLTLRESLARAADIQHKFDATILLGDFNLNADWNDPPIPRDRVASDFLSTFYDLFLMQLVTKATRIKNNSRSILDLVLCIVSESVYNLNVIPGVSDHLAIAFSYNVYVKRTPPPRRHVYNFKRANWQKLSAKFCELLPLNFQQYADDVDGAWVEYRTLFFECVDSCIFKCFIRNRKQHDWIDSDIVKSIKRRDRLYKKCTKHPTPSRWERYRVVRNALKRMIRNAYDKYMHSLGLAKNRKKLWKFMRSKLNNSNSGTFLINGAPVSDAREICKAFSDNFKMNFAPSNRDQCELFPPSQPAENPLEHSTCTAAEVKVVLQKIKAEAATGPDGIPAVILINCAEALAPSLSAFYNFTLSKGKYPKGWKHAHVIPIFKSGSRANIENYRPISLTSLVSKCIERIVCNHLYMHLRRHNLLNNNQHGFIPGKSCTTLLAHVLDDWYQGLNSRSSKQIDIIALDWAKAFDRVPHKRLCMKLSNMLVRGRVLNWISSFLSDRTQSVVYRGETSAAVQVPSGSPQGCVLSPLLFTSFMLDLPRCVQAPLAQYADDSTLYKEISDVKDAEELQEDLRMVDVWCKNNDMALNVPKCAHMTVTRSPSPLITSFLLNNENIPTSSNLKILGVHISSDLKWNIHTEAVRSKAMRTLGMITKCFSGRDSSSIKLLFTSMARPIMTYGAPAWHPTTVGNIDKLERVQARTTRLVLGYKRFGSCQSREDRLRACNLPSISVLFEKIDTKFPRKCLVGTCLFSFSAL